MTHPIRTHHYQPYLAKGDHAGNERCAVCGLPEGNKRYGHDPLLDVPDDIRQAEARRYGERQEAD